jgi:Ca-activated chloride channel family protein
MRWESPWMLLLLLVVPLLVMRARRPEARPAAVLWSRGPTVGSRVGALWFLVFDLLPWAALVIALVALARPQQGLRQSETESRGIDIVLALDVSPSMAAEDFRPSNRLAVAKQTARDFVRQRKHDRLGLVGFAGTAFTQCPLTLDHDAVVEMLDQLNFGMTEEGTAIGMGLATAVSALRSSKSPSKVIVLLTDGQNNRGAIDPLTGAELARALGVKVHTVLVGRGGVVPVPLEDPLVGRRVEMVRMDVDEGTLRELASRTGGRFFRAQDPAALAGIYGEIDRLERAPIKSVEYREYEDLGPRMLAVAALLMGVFVLGSTTVLFRVS